MPVRGWRLCGGKQPSMRGAANFCENFWKGWHSPSRVPTNPQLSLLPKRPAAPTQAAVGRPSSTYRCPVRNLLGWLELSFPVQRCFPECRLNSPRNSSPPLLPALKSRRNVLTPKLPRSARGRGRRQTTPWPPRNPRRRNGADAGCRPRPGPESRRRRGEGGRH
jgi:hypothetical protein